jgi:YesN/AraC family two-component response regulator
VYKNPLRLAKNGHFFVSDATALTSYQKKMVTFIVWLKGIVMIYCIKLNVFGILAVWFLIIPRVVIAQEITQQDFETVKGLLPDKPDLADSMCSKLLKQATESRVENDSILAKIYLLAGLTQYYKGRYFVAEYYYKLAMKTSFMDQSKSFGENCWNNLGIVLERQNRLGEAQVAYKKSLRFAEERGDSVSIIQTWINIGLLEGAHKDYEEAIAITNQVLQWALSNQDTLNTALCYQNLGIYYAEIRQMQKAVSFSEKALVLYRLNQDQYLIAKQLSNLANFLAYLGRYSESKLRLEEALKIAERNNFGEVIASTYTILAHNNIALNQNLFEAEEYLNRSLKYSMDNNLLATSDGVLTNLLRLYVKTGEIEKHDATVDALQGLMERSNKEASSGLYEEMKVVHELSVIQAKNKKLLEEAENRKFYMRLQLLFIVVISVFVSIVSVLYFRLKKYVLSLYKLNVEQTVSSGIVLPSFKQELQVAENGDQLYDLYLSILQKLEEERLYENPSFAIQDICEKLKSNRSYISMAINQYSNTNFAGLVSRLRVNEARKLMLDIANPLSLTEISTRAGFSNRVSFYRQFKEITGLSPTEFRALTV